MASYIMHMCVSDIVKRKLNLTDKFIYGSVLPDILKEITSDRDTTHYIEQITIDGNNRKLPNIQKAIKEVDIKDNEIRLGYIAHLVEDYIWFNDFIPTYAMSLGNGNIKYFKDQSIHSKSEYRDAIYSDYSNSSKYVINKCGVNMQNLLMNIKNIAENEKCKKIILDNTNCVQDENVNKNTFMTKESIDKYIAVCTKEVERIISNLMGE